MLFLAIAGKAQELTYSNKKVNTDIKFFNVKLGFFDFLVSKSRMTMSAGLGGKLYLNGLYLGLNYDYQYVDQMAEASSTENIKGSSIYKPTRSRYGDATIAYYKQTEKEGQVKIFLKGVGRTKYYALVDAKYNKFFGVQLGYKSGFSYLTVPAGINVKDYHSNAEVTTENGLTTFMQYGWISVGPSFGKITDVSADFKGYGNKKNREFVRYYANLIYAVSSNLEDVYFNADISGNNRLINQYVLQGNTAMSKIGFNVGLETLKFYGVGLIGGIEGGMMPGVKVTGAGNVYISLKVGMGIGKSFVKN